MINLEDYWQSAFPDIEGWVDTRLLDSLTMVDGILREAQVGGHVGEIGVYHGKFLLALAHLTQPGDKVTAIDVFADQTRNIDKSGTGSLERLKDNIARYGVTGRDYAFIQADSLSLTATDKLKIMADRGPFRLFSVDGCHTAEHTCTDLLTAQEWLTPGGVLILDDYMQPHWPGVTEAVSMFFSRYVPRMRPFLYTCHKLFFTSNGWHAEYLAASADRLDSSPNARTVEMFSTPVMTIYP